MTTTKAPGVFQVAAYRCRCGHEWVTKDLHQAERPKMCPRCKTVNWDLPYRPSRKTSAETQLEGVKEEVAVG